jgi:hypothetical protein
MTAEPADTLCPRCGTQGRRLVSRITRGRGEDARIDELADHVETMGEPENSATMRRLMRDMGKAMDEDLSEDLEAMLESDLEGREDEE